MVDATIGFIGAGQMARALAAGFVRAGLIAPERLLAADPHEAARAGFAAQVDGARVVADNRQVAKAANVLFLAVKPQQMSAVLGELGPAIGPGHLVISIAAGVRLRTIASALGEGARLIRVMPNTPCLVGQSASGFARGPAATAADVKMVKQLLESVGRACELDEKLLDAVTGLAGSGPAFVFTIIEALSDGGVLMGLPREVATALAAQTVRGAAELLQTSGLHPGVLKDQVASPGGTTMAGLQALEEHGVRAGLMAAVQAATMRSIELSQS